MSAYKCLYLARQMPLEALAGKEGGKGVFFLMHKFMHANVNICL